MVLLSLKKPYKSAFFKNYVKNMFEPTINYDNFSLTLIYKLRTKNEKTNNDY